MTEPVSISQTNATWFVHSLEWTKSNFSHIKESPFNSMSIRSTLFIHRRQRRRRRQRRQQRKQRRRIMCFTFNLLMCIQIKWSHSLLLSLSLHPSHYFNSIKMYVGFVSMCVSISEPSVSFKLVYFLRFVLFTLSDYF